MFGLLDDVIKAGTSTVKATFSLLDADEIDNFGDHLTDAITSATSAGVKTAIDSEIMEIGSNIIEGIFDESED